MNRDTNKAREKLLIGFLSPAVGVPVHCAALQTYECHVDVHIRRPLHKALCWACVSFQSNHSADLTFHWRMPWHQEHGKYFNNLQRTHMPQRSKTYPEDAVNRANPVAQPVLTVYVHSSRDNTQIISLFGLKCVIMSDDLLRKEVTFHIVVLLLP